MTKKRLSVSFQLFEWYDLHVYHFNYLSGTICILAVLSNCQIWRNAQSQVGLLANCRQYGGVGADCGLHPLIHTLASGASAQNAAVKLSR
jgi:hypothetical protein